MDFKDYQKALRDLLIEAERAVYQRGYRDAVKKIVAAAQPESQPDQPTLLPYVVHRDVRPHNLLMSSLPPVIVIVSDLVKAFPGQRGTAIVDMVAQKTGDRDRKRIDRTVRTALMRLKQRKEIEARDGQWWPRGGEKVTPPVGSAAH